ncbi:MAG: hypothetical protein HZA68_19680 [Rhodovulum sp.]|nr:hypothetical protein [Rhodovulum sp.]
MAPFDPTIGLIVVGRGDPRLAGATLASLRHWRSPPNRVVLAVPKGREHAFAAIAAGAAVTLVATAEADLLAAGLAALADHVELVVAAPEGVVFEPGWLDAMRDRAMLFEDLVGGIDLVHRAVKITPEGDAPLAEPAHDAPMHDAPMAERWLLPTLRRVVRARSLMGALLWARVAVLPQIRLATAGEGGDAIAFVLALDQLARRGRTEMGFTRHARHLRLLPERRTGFDAGYGLYRRLEQVAEARRAAAVGAPAASHLDLRIERLRLLAEQAVRALIGRAGKHNAATFLKGALAARRDGLAVRRTVLRDLRELR